jgi:hypothetical protein
LKKNRQMKLKLPQKPKLNQVKFNLSLQNFQSLISLDEATGTDEKKTSSKNKKKAAAEKKAKGGVDPKTVRCFSQKRISSKLSLRLFSVKSYERISKETGRS